MLANELQIPLTEHLTQHLGRELDFGRVVELYIQFTFHTHVASVKQIIWELPLLGPVVYLSSTRILTFTSIYQILFFKCANIFKTHTTNRFWPLSSFLSWSRALKSKWRFPFRPQKAGGPLQELYFWMTDSKKRSDPETLLQKFTALCSCMTLRSAYKRRRKLEHRPLNLFSLWVFHVEGFAGTAFVSFSISQNSPWP